MKEDEFVKKILQDIRSEKNNFSDIGGRITFLSRFKENINTLWDLVPEDDCSKNLVMVLADSVKNIKVESLNYDQLCAIEDTVEAFLKGNVTEDKLDFYIELLVKKDIPLVLLPGNISDLYD